MSSCRLLVFLELSCACLKAAAVRSSPLGRNGDTEVCQTLLCNEKQLAICCSFQICYCELRQDEATFQQVA